MIYKEVFVIDKTSRIFTITKIRVMVLAAMAEMQQYSDDWDYFGRGVLYREGKTAWTNFKDAQAEALRQIDSKVARLMDFYAEITFMQEPKYY